MNIESLITGGSGMLGQDLAPLFDQRKNYFLSSKDCDLRNPAQVDSIINLVRPYRVIHLAARVGGIQDNMRRPADYFSDNVLMNTNILNACVKYDVERFIGMLSSCIYPDVASSYPMKESQIHESPPAPSNFSYGYAKRCMLVQVEAINKQFGKQYQCLIPPNMYGPGDKYDDKHSHFVAALVKKIYLAKQSGQSKITLFGTGKPLRQFIYSPDIAHLIQLCVINDITETMNLISDEMSYSIDAIARLALKACEAEHLKIVYDKTKPDGQFNKAIDGTVMKTWFPSFRFTNLEVGIKATYKAYERENE